MTDLLKEAIADAKAVREVALANAKLALEEAFTPRLQSMLASKLSEEAEEGEDHDEETMGEAAEEEETPEVKEGETEEEPVEEEYGNDWFEEEPGSMGEGEEHEEEAPVEEGEDEEETMDEDLMEIIRQLEEDIDSSEIGTGDNKQPSKVASDDSTEMKKEKLVQLVKEEEEEAPVEEGDDSEGDEVDIQEILRALREEDSEEGGEEEHMEEGEDKEEEMAEVKLQEAYAVIQFLREKINEVNLLNSKLLFSNKLFRSHSLTESQKMTVIENFDRAKSLREVKLVYATLAESLKTAKVKQLKESFASKPVASTRPSKAILTESNEMANRLRKLAGLN